MQHSLMTQSIKTLLHHKKTRDMLNYLLCYRDIKESCLKLMETEEDLMRQRNMR